MKRYIVRLQHYKKGRNGATRYRYSTRVKAILFAAGYQAALHDIGKTDLYVTVWEIDSESGVKPRDADNYEHLCVADSDYLTEIAGREC